jgi:hypothetical protein
MERYGQHMNLVETRQRSHMPSAYEPRRDTTEITYAFGIYDLDKCRVISTSVVQL